MRGWDLFVDRRVENPVGGMLAQVKSGDLGAAVIWRPLAGPLVKQDPDLQFTPLLKEAGGRACSFASPWASPTVGMGSSGQPDPPASGRNR